MRRLILIPLTALALAGCASLDPNIEARNQEALAEFKAELSRERQQAVEVRHQRLEAIKSLAAAEGADDSVRMMAILALSMDKDMPPTAPRAAPPVLQRGPSLLDGLLGFGNLLIQGYSVHSGKQVAIHQSDNARRTQEAMFNAISDLGDNPAGDHYTIGGNGVIGDGQFSEAGGLGAVIGGGTGGGNSNATGTGSVVGSGTGGGNQDNTHTPVVVQVPPPEVVVVDQPVIVSP